MFVENSYSYLYKYILILQTLNTLYFNFVKVKHLPLQKYINKKRVISNICIIISCIPEKKNIKISFQFVLLLLSKHVFFNSGCTVLHLETYKLSLKLYNNHWSFIRDSYDLLRKKCNTIFEVIVTWHRKFWWWKSGKTRTATIRVTFVATLK